ncbi:hypothetical protein B0H19DRAFT_921216 [Mycena capillaripes]|nr:hypothetical protein B0H19DRAFT_921216 [Mycena capillaripes]
MRTDCECVLLIKTYPGVTMVLGNYKDEHNHPLGNENLRFTRISKETREYIAGLLRLKVSPSHILQLVHQGVYNQDDIFDVDRDEDATASRNEFIQLQDIRRIEKAIEAETVRLHPDDGESTVRWVEKLRSEGKLLGFKAKSDPPPPGSGLDPDTFTLMLHGTQSTIQYFLRLHRLRSPLVIPRRIMSDFCWPQINACIAEYCAFILLCWWHVLHAWQQHFKIGSHPDLWELLKRWIRITDETEFNATWDRIKKEAPKAFVEYLAEYWMPTHVVRMWSAVYRKDRNIFQACDTNMLIEAWHHRRQDLGFEGIDIEVKKRQDILKRSQEFAVADIQPTENGKYLVRSKSNPSRSYEVDLSTYTCTCLDFPLICFCKHIAAVQAFYEEAVPAVSVPGSDTCQDRQDAGDDTSSNDSSVSDLPQPPAVVGPKPRVLTLLAEKLETLAARLRRPRTKESDLPSLSNLNTHLADMLKATDTGTVLPSAQYLRPNIKNLTQRAARVMPRVKRKAQKTGDPAYGGGASSGLKAKKVKTMCVHFATAVIVLCLIWILAQ